MKAHLLQLVVIFTVWFSVASHAFAEPNVVVVEGFADMAAGKSVARRQALVDAYRQAISEGGLVEVGSYSETENFMMVSDVMRTRSHGFIQRYDLLEEGLDPADSNLYRVQIKAEVVTGPDGDDAASLKAFVGMIDNPTLLFLIDDSGASDTLTTSRLENELAAHFRKVGYKIKTGDDVKMKGDITLDLINAARAGNGAAAAQVARALNADFVLTGAVSVQMTEMSGGTDVMAKIGNVSLSVKSIIPGNGEVIGVDTSRDRYMSVQQDASMIAREKAIAKAASRVAKKLMWQIPDYLAKHPRTVILTVENLPFQGIKNLEAQFKKVSSVSAIDMQEWSSNTGTFALDVTFTGPKESDVVGLMLDWYPSLQVQQVGNYRINVAM